MTQAHPPSRRSRRAVIGGRQENVRRLAAWTVGQAEGGRTPLTANAAGAALSGGIEGGRQHPSPRARVFHIAYAGFRSSTVVSQPLRTPVNRIHDAARNRVHRVVAGKLLHLSVASLADGEERRGRSLPRTAVCPTPTPRELAIVDPRARRIPETPRKGPETASESVAESFGTQCQVSVPALRPSRYTVQSSMSRRRRSNRSVLRYAASTLFCTTCASAASMTSRGWSVLSAAQSRNDDRNP